MEELNSTPSGRDIAPNLFQDPSRAVRDREGRMAFIVACTGSLIQPRTVWLHGIGGSLYRAFAKDLQLVPDFAPVYVEQRPAIRRQRITPLQRYEVYEAAGGRCHLCGAAVRYDDMHVDHVVPLAQGGTDEPSNWGATHPACNMKKGRRMPVFVRSSSAPHDA